VLDRRQLRGLECAFDWILYISSLCNRT
jgi:hypothetical protein